MISASPADSPAATRRVSDEQVTRDVEEVQRWGLSVFVLSAGYPADLRDSLARETALRAENAELKRQLEKAEAGSPTATRRVSDEELREIIGKLYLVEAGSTFERVCITLRDSRTSETALRAENAELKRKLEAAEAKLADAERAGMERAAEIAERREQLNIQCGNDPLFGVDPLWHVQRAAEARGIASLIRAAMPAGKDEEAGR